MQKEYKTKDISAPLEDYHFSGGGEYEPITIKARDRDEAEKIWREQRKKVEQPLQTKE